MPLWQAGCESWKRPMVWGEHQSCYGKHRVKRDYRRHLPGELTTHLPEPHQLIACVTPKCFSSLVLCPQTPFLTVSHLPEAVLAMTLGGNKLKLPQQGENLRTGQNVLSLISCQAEGRLLYARATDSSTNFH